MIKIIQKRRIYFWLSGVMVAVSLLAILFWGLPLGIDFTGGTLLEVSLEAKPENQLQFFRQTLEKEGFLVSSIQETGEDSIIFRLEPLTQKQHQQVIKLLTEAVNQLIKSNGENESHQALTERRFETIGPVIGRELKRKALTALGLALLAIIAYISWAFRKVTKPVASWKYGIGAIIALVHDVLIVTGAFAVLGKLKGFEVDLLFITALLTILGFSVHDTIVVYDRTRENLLKAKAGDFEEIVNKSVNSTLARSVNTSFTTLLVLVFLYIFGGDTLKPFILALIIGIIVGTYSSIFLASPLLVVWHKRGILS